MKRSFSAITTLSACLVCGSFAFAQTADNSLKEKLTNTTGSKLHKFTFKITSDSAGKNVLWTESQYCLNLSDDSFNMTFASSKGMPDKILSGKGPNYVTVYMDDGPIPTCPPTIIPPLNHSPLVINKGTIFTGSGGLERPGKCCTLNEAYHAGQTITPDRGPVVIEKGMDTSLRVKGPLLMEGFILADYALNLMSGPNAVSYNDGITQDIGRTNFWRQGVGDLAVLMSVMADGKVIIGTDCAHGMTRALPDAGLAVHGPVEITDSRTNDCDATEATFGGNAILLKVAGEACKTTGGGSWHCPSDARLKTNIQSFEQGLNVLLSIRPVEYQYNGKAQTQTHKNYIGVIAQEIQQVAPYTVSSRKMRLDPEDAEETDILMFDASALTYITINAVKELNQKVDELRDLNSKYEQLQDRMNKLEAAIAKPSGKLAQATSR